MKMEQGKLSHPSLARHKFLSHLARNAVVGLIAIVIALLIGMWGYHYFEDMSWEDAFVNAAMILSSMGPMTPLHTTAGKIFAGLYALFSGLAFLLIVGIIFVPVMHRFFLKIHLESHADVKSSK